MIDSKEPSDITEHGADDARDAWLEKASAKHIVLFVVCLWVFFPFVLWIFYPSLQDRGQFGDSYAVVNTLFSGLAFGGVVYALILQRRELRLQRRELKEARIQYARSARALEESQGEAVKARSANVFFHIMEILQSLRPKWHRLYALSKDHHEWTPEEIALADLVSVNLQYVSYLCMSGFIDDSYVMEGWHRVFIQCWERLEGYIKDYRAECGEPRELKDGAYQRMHFEQFVEKCRNFEEKRKNAFGSGVG